MTKILHVYTGSGKGKSSAAFGVAARALGRGQKVYVIQFLKGGQESGECLFFEKLKDDFWIKWKRFGSVNFVRKEEISEKDLREAREALEWAKRSLLENFDLLILDELCVALFFDLLKWEEVEDFLKEALKSINVVVTGRKALRQLLEMADLVTEMKEIKHPYTRGEAPIKGLDY
jgi:cob(I)alamin adenosyltransferase